MKKIIITLTIILAVLVGISFFTPFCNFYADHIYGYINLLEGSVTGILPFALGEIIMYIGALVILMIPVFLILLIFVKSLKYRAFIKKYLLSVLTVALVFLIIYCTNWFIPFRADTIKITDNEDTTFSFVEVLDLRNQIVEKINELSYEVDRDENGHLTYEYTAEEVFEGMRSISDEFPRLKGHYSPMKPALCSPFLDWMNIGGYNYIYTMEPTNNIYLYPLDYPRIYAHELAHHKGYYKENEANFLGFLGLINSDNKYLQYCSYIDILYWIECDLFTVDNNELIQSAPYIAELNNTVYTDISNSINEGDQFYEENVNKALESSFSGVSAEIADTGWEIQGDILKEDSYRGVTLMVLQYYLRR